SNGGRTFNESEAGWEAYISCDIVPPDDITMIGSGSFTTCESNFYDGGGQNGDYLLNQDVITTLFPTNISNRISVTFTSFTTSNNKDALYVYNGADINKELITTLSRNDNPGTISSTANDGSLTFRFISDGSNISYYNESGWEATISCICNDAIGGIATLSSSTLCIGSENQSTLTLSDFLGSSIQWQSSIDSVSWIDIEGATNSTYLISSPEISLFYRAVVLNDCSSAYSTVVKLTVLEIPIRCDIIYGPSNICKGVNSVLYSVSEILNVTSYIWELPVGATGSSTTNSIAVNFGSNAVSGILKVKGFNDCGYGAESSLLITVGSLPDNAGAISGESDVCVGSEYTYTVSSITGATSYIWELPAGASGESTTNSIIVNYGADAVSGDIKVKGHNDCGDGQESIFAVTVYSQPEAAGTISGNNIVCQGTTNTYSVLTISGATSYNWTLPAGATGASTTNSISVTFGSSAVSGDISVKGHNQCFDGEESSLSIAVNSVPEAAGIITGNENVCQGTSNVVYTVPLIPGATSYVWTLPAGAEVTTIENEIELSFGISSTSGTLKVKGCNDCGDGSESSLLITVSSLPENAGNILGESDVCLGSGYTYTVPSITGATSYFWEFPDGATGASTTNTITVNYDTNAVSGNIKVKGHNDCGEGQESTLSVTVISQPEAAGTIFGENVVCKGTSNIYTVPAISGATSYNWTLPAGATGASTTNSILVTFGNSAVSGDLFVKGHNQCFEGEESSLSITVKSVPEAASIITGDENVCQGTSNVVYSVTVIPGATSYVWTLPAGAEVITTVNEVELSFSTSSTSGTLKVTGRNDCGDGEENSLQINVFPKPDQPVITQDVDTLTSSALTGNQWYYENTIISGATNQTLVIDKSGNYYVIVTSLEECISSPSNILSAHCSWNDGIKNYQLKIYPNPTTGEINISGLPDGKKIEVSVVNMEGRLIKKQKVTSIDPTINIDNTIPGSYLFIIDGQVNQAIKIIKK
ncbi:MAG: T9SS type A sorting domain-containing protein, partial [Prolixibacteraceae bacterium]|nr:T9SS type A sorting domain-containing protein [Prolixibacteraceae bacterium]MBN2774658.1 T9SS type A sorting domain-containing protein [Prolixibacteraceae bacterium]